MIMQQHELDANTKAGTIGGTLLIIFSNPVAEVVHTAVVAGVGAAVSFLVSLLLKFTVLHFRKPKKSRKVKQKRMRT
jgi:hypothetical protein